MSDVTTDTNATVTVTPNELRQSSSPIPGAGGKAHTARGGLFGGLVRTVRPRQWPKNILILAAPVLLEPAALLHSVVELAIAVVAFCAAASAVYVLNDLVDRQKDLQHPVKRYRPIACGLVRAPEAVVLSIGCAAASIAVSLALPDVFTVLIIVYMCLNILYCLRLKHQALVDVIIVATGFVIRVAAGAIVSDLPISLPIITCVFSMCLLMSFGKRRHEISLLASRPQNTHRPSTVGFTIPFVDQIIAMLAAITVVSYAAIQFSVDSASDWRAAITVPFAFFAMMRYLMMLSVDKAGGSPAEDIASDRPMLINLAAWIGVLALMEVL